MASRSPPFVARDPAPAITAISALPALSVPQVNMVLGSEPDHITGEEGAGVELRTGADYAVAKALKRHGLGYVEGPGGPMTGMYFNNAEGLRVRRIIMGGVE